MKLNLAIAAGVTFLALVFVTATEAPLLVRAVVGTLLFAELLGILLTHVGPAGRQGYVRSVRSSFRRRICAQCGTSQMMRHEVFCSEECEADHVLGTT